MVKTPVKSVDVAVLVRPGAPQIAGSLFNNNQPSKVIVLDENDEKWKTSCNVCK